MLKKLAFVLLLLPFLASAQDTIHVKIDPNTDYNKIMLYQVVGANQKYIANAAMVFDEFEFIIPEDTNTGMYRLYFDVQNGGYFDLIYNNESISVTFDSKNPEESAVFDKSQENRTYQAYLNQIDTHQYKLDSIQYAYFNPDKKPVLKELYEKELQKLEFLQRTFESKSKELFAYGFIKSSKKYNHPKIIDTSQEYLKLVNDHFYDFIDFGNEKLYNSSFFVDKAVEYIFYINGSNDVEIDKQLKKNAIEKTMEKVGDNYFIRNEILSSLIYALAGQQDIEVTRFLIDNYYNQLPEEYKSVEFILKIESSLKTAFGAVAPEISLNVDGKEMLLTDLDVAQIYILVFWSTTCSHCMIEIPQLYEFSETLEQVKVIAVALEENSIGFNEQIKKTPNWIHVLGLNKWQNEYAKSYNINSTPTYFVLDADKKFIAKPEELENLKAFFGVN